MSTTLDANSMQRFLEQFTETLSPELADRFVSTPSNPEFQTRIDELAGKANEGILSEDERREYTTYIEAMDMMALLKSRVLLKQKRAAE